MAFRQFSYLGVGNDIGTSSRLAMRGEPQIFVGEANKGINPLDTAGLFSIGRPKNLPDFKRVVDTEKIQAGYPKSHLYSFPLKEEIDLTFSIDHPKLEAFQMQRGDVAVVPRYATTGQTTIATGSTPTKYTATLTSTTGIAVGDLCHVETKHPTLGGFNEVVYIKSVAGNVVTYEGLTNAPLADAWFKKIAGKVTGTGISDTGFYLPNALTTKLEVYHFVFVVPLVGSKGELVVSVPEMEIKPEGLLPNFGQALAEMSFSGMPCTQPEKSFTLIDGSTELRPWTMEAYWIPYESA